MNSLLPSSSSLFEQATETSLADRWDTVGAAVPYIRLAKQVTRPPSFLPHLVYEFGLGQISPYVPNVYNLVTEGVRWQRIRGTYAGVTQGLSFLNVTASVIPAWHGREWWNSCELHFDELPETDNPLLDRIEGIVGLSLAFRSDFRRGVHLYDARPAECDGSRLDDALLENESGIRLHENGALWSFGRVTEIEHVLTEEEGLAIGNWVEPPETDGIKWVDMTYPWAAATILWADNPAAQRRALMAGWFVGQRIFATLRGADAAVIGHRICRAVWPCASDLDGAYAFNGQTYQPLAGGKVVYVEALTDFDDADGIEAASVELTIGAALADGVPPGRAWLAPADLVGGEPIASTDISLSLRRAVREQIKFLLRF